MITCANWAAGKVRKILAYIFNQWDFADRLQREKYDFLRNKETFQLHGLCLQASLIGKK